ncbi:MAG: hypothetical protein AB1938_08285 [Myxococcota bacterium]
MTTPTADMVAEALAAVLREQQKQLGPGQRGEDEAIALRYAANAARRTLAWASADTRADWRALAEALGAALREAAVLYRQERDDEDGFGLATLRQVVRDFGQKLNLDLTPDAPAVPDWEGELGAAVGLHRWHPAYFRSQFEALSEARQAAFIERAMRLASYAHGLVPTAMDHVWFLAWCWALHGRWDLAAAHVKAALHAGQALLEAAEASPGHFEAMLYDAHRLSEALARHAMEGPAPPEAKRVLFDGFAAVVAARSGPGSEAHRAAVALAQPPA